MKQEFYVLQTNNNKFISIDFCGERHNRLVSVKEVYSLIDALMTSDKKTLFVFTDLSNHGKYTPNGYKIHFQLKNNSFPIKIKKLKIELVDINS